MTAQPIRGNKTLVLPKTRVAKARPPFWYKLMASLLSGGSLVAAVVIYFMAK